MKKRGDILDRETLEELLRLCKKHNIELDEQSIRECIQELRLNES